MKKAFTLIELLIVIILIGLLFGFFKNSFSYKNVEEQKFDTCYIYTYSRLSNFMEQALLQKMVYSGNILTGVKSYVVDFDVNNQKLSLIYSGDTKVVKTIAYSGSYEDENGCFTKTYRAKLSGYNLKFKINPGLQADINDSPVKLYTGNSTNFTTTSGSIDLWYCQGNECKQKYKFIFVPSTYLLLTKYCMQLSNNGTCAKWSK